MFRAIGRFRFTRIASLYPRTPQLIKNSSIQSSPALNIPSSDSISLSFTGSQSSHHNRNSDDKSSKSVSGIRPLTKGEEHLKKEKETIKSMINAGVPVLGIHTNSRQGQGVYQFDTTDPVFQKNFSEGDSDPGFRVIHIPDISMKHLFHPTDPAQHLLPSNCQLADVETETNDPHPDWDWGPDDAEEPCTVQRWQTPKAYQNKNNF